MTTSPMHSLLLALAAATCAQAAPIHGEVGARVPLMASVLGRGPAGFQSLSTPITGPVVTPESCLGTFVTLGSRSGRTGHIALHHKPTAGHKLPFVYHMPPGAEFDVYVMDVTASTMEPVGHAFGEMGESDVVLPHTLHDGHEYYLQVMFASPGLACYAESSRFRIESNLTPGPDRCVGFKVLEPSGPFKVGAALIALPRCVFFLLAHGDIPTARHCSGRAWAHH
jgi:hypothetical protein